MNVKENIGQQQARSAYAFIAVCDSARNDVNIFTRQAPRSGAANPAMTCSAATRRMAVGMSSKPCAVAHGYKHVSATRLFKTQIL